MAATVEIPESNPKAQTPNEASPAARGSRTPTSEPSLGFMAPACHPIKQRSVMPTLAADASGLSVWRTTGPQQVKLAIMLSAAGPSSEMAS